MFYTVLYKLDKQNITLNFKSKKKPTIKSLRKKFKISSEYFFLKQMYVTKIVGWDEILKISFPIISKLIKIKI